MPAPMRSDMGYDWIPARHFRTGRIEQVGLIVIHTAEVAEGAMSAHAVAQYFATTSRAASAHFCVDNEHVVQCVRVIDTAFAAPGANANGVQIELSGYARQTPDEWDDTFSVQMLKLAASVVADVARRFAIPIVEIDEDGLKRRMRGITTHAAVSRAFRKSTHTDPGPFFPLEFFLDLCQCS